MASRLTQIFERFLFGDDRPAKAKESRQEPPRQTTAAQPSGKAKDDGLPTLAMGASPVSASTTPPAKLVDKIGERYSAESTKWSETVKPSMMTRITFLGSREKDTEPKTRIRWEPGFFQLRPLAGLGSLAITIACIVASLAILLVSDGAPVTSWQVQPTVYLAIVTAISNAALVYARERAVPVSWWYHASRGGTIKSLQRHYEVSQSLTRAVINARSPSLLHLACIATSLVIIDGALLQRASRVIFATRSQPVMLDLALSPELPAGFSGYCYEQSFWPTYASDGLVFQWMDDVPIYLDAPKCQGVCRATVQGPGLAKQDCTSQVWPITPAILHSFNATWGPWKGIAPAPSGETATLPACYVKLSTPTEYSAKSERELVLLDVGLATWSDFKGEYRQSRCKYAAAIVEYDIRIEGGKISLASSDDQGRVLRLANNTTPPNQDILDVKQPSTLVELVTFLNIFVYSNATVALNSLAHGTAAVYSPQGESFDPEVLRHVNRSVNSWKDLQFIDPTPVVISKFNQLMLRGGIMIASWPNMTNLIDPGVSRQQRVQAEETIHDTVFHTDLRWYAGAAIVELVTVLFVLPMFWGWWTIPNLTLSPIETALAFNAPLLEDINSGAGAKGVVEELGSTGIRYGVVSRLESDGGGGSDTEEDCASGRLGIGTRESVTRPRKGIRFQI